MKPLVAGSVAQVAILSCNMGGFAVQNDLCEKRKRPVLQ